jgi:hypothetical protein
MMKFTNLLTILSKVAGVSLGVDVFHHDLEVVEATSIGNLDLLRETLYKVLVDNSV